MGGTELPKDMKIALSQLATGLDAAQTDIVAKLASIFGGDSAEAVGDVANIALLSRAGRAYGLLDCVLYRPQDAATEVVAPHSDPGLLVMALPSDPGLELRDEVGHWLTPPEDCGVLWTGHAAQHCPPAIHRVTMSVRPRFAMWHELCTRSQVAPPMLEQLHQQGMELQLGSVRGTAKVLDLFEKIENRDAVRKEFKAFKGINALKLEPMIVPRNTQASTVQELIPRNTQASTVQELKRWYRQDLLRRTPQTLPPTVETTEVEAMRVSSSTPLDPSPTLPSKGSRHHAQPCPKICRMHKRDAMCHYGNACEFCHFDHQEAISRGTRRGQKLSS